MTTDLALIAERRGGLAALLGLLLLEEPGPAIGEYVAAIPALAQLATGDPAIATEYERVFLRGVALYESVFRSDDGQHGGATVRTVVECYERVGFTEHLDGRWRIAGADHLGLQLRCLAQLCQEEAAAWREGTPDKAMAAVETERTFLADHLAGWAPVAVRSAMDCAASGTYASLLSAVDEYLIEEFDRLRPAPDLGGEIEIETLPSNLGPARLTRLLLAPAICGAWLSATTISDVARSIGAPWRPSDTRSALHHVIEDAQNSGQLHVILEPIADHLAAAIAAYREDAVRSPGNAANAKHWVAVAEAMRMYLAEIGEAGLGGRGESTFSETLTIQGAESCQLADAIDEAVVQLRDLGLHVERNPKREASVDVTRRR